MKEQRKRILQLVENGTISAEEAISLLEKLEKPTEKQAEEAVQPSTPAPKVEEQENKQDATDFEGFDPKKEANDSSEEDEFIDDLKKDFAQFSTKLMDFVGAAVTKVKDMDFSSMSPSSKKLEWKISLEQQTFSNISVDLPNGQVKIRDSADGSTFVEVAATPMLQFGSSNDTSEEEMKNNVHATIDAGTLRVTNSSKSLKTDLIIYVPKGEYQKIRVHQFNGAFTLHSIDVDQLRVETKNGAINLSDSTFDSAELETANGAIDIRDVSGRDLDAKTLNGRVYIDGILRSTEAKSVNGHIVLTTKSQQAERIKAETTTGTIEIYVPKTLSLIGEVSSSIGKMDIELGDVELMHETNQMFVKRVRFSKSVEDASKLTIDGEIKSGSVIIRYTI